MVTAAGPNESQLDPTTSGGTTVTGAWNNATSTARYGVEVATGNGITIGANRGVQINTGNNIFIRTTPVPSVPANTTVELARSQQQAIGKSSAQTTSGGTTVTGAWNKQGTARYGVEVATGNGITIGDRGVEINTGNNIFINNSGALSAANTTVAAGTVTAAGPNESQLDPTTRGGTTVTGAWNNATSTARYGVEVATGDGITIGDRGVEINTGNNIFINNSGALSAANTTVAAGTVTAADAPMKVNSTQLDRKAPPSPAPGITPPPQPVTALKSRWQRHHHW